MIVEEVGFLARPSQLRLIPGSARALALLNARDVPVVVVTNQSGVARGYFTEEDVAAVSSALDSLLAREGARVDRYEFCPHHLEEGIGPFKKDCPRRKPNPGMLLDAAKALDLDLGRSFLIGDRVSDLQAAQRAGCRGILVRTGYGAKVTKDEWEAAGVEPFLVEKDLLSAVKAVLPLFAPGEED